MCAAQGMFRHVLLAMGGSAAVMLGYALALVLRASPWWQPQYLLPALVVFLATCISTVAAGLACIVQEVTEGAFPCTRDWSLGLQLGHWSAL